MPDLDVPNPPSELSYPEALDFRHEQILVVNGISLAEADLLQALETERGILRASAAHVLGAHAVESAIPALEALLDESDDLVRVEAAYALARMNVPSGTEALLGCLDLPIEAYVCPSLAAGYLAREGNPAGRAVIVRALAAELSGTRVSACQQLYFFVPFDGTPLDDGQRFDVLALFDRALQDSDGNVVWQALVQRRYLQWPESRRVLEAFAARSADESLRRAATRSWLGCRAPDGAGSSRPIGRPRRRGRNRARRRPPCAP